MESNFLPAKKIVTGIIGLIAWFALALQFSLTLKTTAATGFSTLKTVINFFSYFTILSNLLVAICLSVVLLIPLSRLGSFFSKTSVQSAIAVYIFIVGLVYNLVLRNIWSPKGWQLVADNLLHVAVPVIYVLYWIILTPKKNLHWKSIFSWLIFPAAYLAYSLVRGAVIHWYPYPFLNATELSYSKVLLNILLMITAFLVTGLLLIGANRSMKKS